MGKRLKSASEGAFFWTRDPEFVPPGAEQALDCCVEQEFAVSRSGELKTLLNAFLETVTGFTNAQACVVRIVLPDEQTLQVISAIGLSGEELDAERIAELACENCSRDAFRHGLCAVDVEDCVTRRASRPYRHFRSVISIPLESSKLPPARLGVFTLFFDTPQTSPSAVTNMAISFADLLGTMIEHVKSNREAKRTELLMERQSIANEIHDSLAQTLNYARMSTTLLSDAVRSSNEAMATKYARDIDESLEISQKVVRALITDFRSEMNPSGLLHALQALAGQFRQRHGIALDCSIRVADLDLPLEHEIQAYHIVQEALSNIAKHSNASHARLIVDYLCGYYVLTVEDNGVGTMSPAEGHYGIVIMRERAHRIGGEIKVESIKGLGTSVQLYFPWPWENWRAGDD